ncbi:hypothetical protein Tco_1445879, partial [Tanacetum coccineum]
MTTLVEFMIIAGADNRLPILEKSMYDSWKSRMELYMKNKENGRMILDSVQNGPLVWPTTVKENGTTRKKKYEELSVTEKLQADYDLRTTNIVLQGLTLDVYAIVNHHKVVKEIWDRVNLLMQGTKLSLQERECKLYDEFDKFSFVKGETLYHSSEYKVSEQSTARIEQICDGCLTVPVFNQGDDPIACLNKAIAFLSVVAALKQGQSYAGTGYKGNATSSRGNNAVGHARVVKCYNCQCEGHMARQYPDIPDAQAAQTTIPNNVAFYTEDLDACDSDCDDVSTAQAVLMANLSNYGSDVISEVPHSDSYHNDLDNQSVHAVQYFEQTPVVDFPDNEITSDSNINPYSQYLQETQTAVVQDTNLYAQQDSMIL